MSFKNADNKLSLAASKVWQAKTWDDPMGDPSGDAGDAIAEHHRRHLLKIVADAGYATPDDYNMELRMRLVNEDGSMSYNTYYLLTTLSIDDCCPKCGNAMEVYRSEFDTLYECHVCGHRE